MIVYHGTTDKRARRIAAEGFLPKKPSRRVWFASSHAYARGRARTQARRSRARPVVMRCQIDLAEFRRKYGRKRVRHTSGIVAIDGPVPPTVLQSCGVPLDTPGTPRELADWVNGVLGLRSYKGVGPRHPGIVRLSTWVMNRVQSEPRRGIRRTELLDRARQWLPEFFAGVRIDPDRLLVTRRIDLTPAAEPPPVPAVDPREEEAVELLDRGGARQRVRGLGLLAEIDDPDLFEWCAMYLEDGAVSVRLAALHTMLRCEQIDPDAVTPLAESPDKRIRGAALAVLARHGGDDAERWFERGLKDPEPCVRLETAGVLPDLDPVEHRAIFRLALYDPNPKVSHLAEKLIAGKGFPKLTWGRRPSHRDGR